MKYTNSNTLHTECLLYSFAILTAGDTTANKLMKVL